MGDFVSLRLPLFFACFACGVVVLLVVFVVWMSFVAGVPTEPDYDVAELQGCIRWVFDSAGDPKHGGCRSGNRCGGVVFQCSPRLAATSHRSAVSGVMDHLDSGGSDRPGILEGDGMDHVIQSEDSG